MQYLFLSFLITFFAVILILKTRIANIALDEPNQRSLHTKLTPRIGGLAIMAGILISWLASAWSVSATNWYWVLFPFILMLTSLTDDIYQLSVKWRLLIQLTASAVFLLVILPHQALWLIILLTLLITWMTNLFNFMDGSDGLAGGMGLFGFATYAIAAYLMGDMHLALMNGVIVAACFAFLLFNFHPAKIFMGDSGSIPLGFLAGSIGVYGYFNALWPVWFPILVFSPFIMDATVTLIKRQMAGEKIWQAHRSHYYQRLVQMGLGHKKTAIVEYFLMLSIAVTAILLLKQSIIYILLALFFWVIAYLIIMRWIDKCWVQTQKSA
ncbi:MULTISPECIES: MraY family glycosyltransferase [Methylotenera]|uniref:MraY family glycosyltransferase n=1 Tax=Methylotenera TaxID=359407 RepID=UPI0003780FB1|nr:MULTISPECIES: glycosyltransferase family 4 protein [Methylotenera]